MPGAKNYCFTINNPERLILFPDGLPDYITYLVYSLEMGKEGTRHLQGYIQFAKQISMKKAHDEPFATAHMETAKGSPEQNKAYCTKMDATHLDGPWELGTMKSQGQRTDLAAAAKIILETGDLSKVDPIVMLKHGSNCLKLMALAEPPRRDGMKVITIIGETGIGKSFAAHECYPKMYMPFYGNSGLWWDGYTGQDVVLIEEFRGQVPLQKMLQILDPYPLRVEVKGGAIPARYKLVIITSNTEPQDWYPDNPLKPEQTRAPERKALLRRLGVGTPRYIVANTRPDLHAALAIALRLEGVIEPVPQPWLGAPLMPAPAPAPARVPTALLDEEICAAAGIPDDFRGPCSICHDMGHWCQDCPLKPPPTAAHVCDMVYDDTPIQIDSDEESPPLKRRNATLHF